MKYKKSLMSLIALIVLSVSISSFAAKEPSVIFGVHEKIPGAEFKYDGKTIEILEYMSFYCHTCYDFEKSIPIILGNFPGKIKWKIVPIYWSDHGSPKPGEAYLIAREMGKGEAIKKAIFHAQMVEKKDIADLSVLEAIGTQVGLGPEFGKKLRAGEKAGEAQKALDMSKTVGISETPTVVIAGNLKTDPHAMNHDLVTFRTNIIAIIQSILMAK